MKKQTQNTAAAKGADNNNNSNSNNSFLDIVKRQKELKEAEEKLKKELEGQKENLIKERDGLLAKVKEINDVLGEISGKKPGRPKMTEEEKAAAKAKRDAAKNNGVTTSETSNIVPITQPATAPAVNQ